jgi:FdrA protein
VVSVCGTDEDPQDYEAQVATLLDAGAIVQASNAQAVRLAGLIAEAAGSRGRPHPLVKLPAPTPPSTVAEVSSILQLLDRPRVINVGLDLFAESLTAQGVEVLAVDWQPPAGGKQKFIDILDKLNA